MIVEIIKYLFVGAKEDLDLFFERAQEKGCIEFISPGGKRLTEFPQRIQNLIAALKVLRKLPVKKPYAGAGDSAYADECAQRVLSLKHEIEKYEEEIRLLRAEIIRVAPFGDFSMGDIEKIERDTQRCVQFFCMKTAKSHKMQFADEVFYISTDYDLDYFMAINPQPVSYPDMMEMRIDRPVGELQNQQVLLKDLVYQLEAELKGYAGHQEFLRECLIEELDAFHLAHVKKEASFPIESSLFAIEGWVPANKTAEIFEIMETVAVHAEQIAIEEFDRVPTYMENKGLPKLGEDLVKVYDIPAPTDKDPSGWVLSAFTLFFAIIVADGGYGLLFLAIAAFLHFKFPDLQGVKKRVLKLFALLSSACILWGILTSSYFGLTIPTNSFLQKISIIHYLAEKKAEYHIQSQDQVHKEWVDRSPHLAAVKSAEEFVNNRDVLKKFSDNILLEFSLLIGVVHVCCSFLRYIRRNWAGVGWILFLIGGYLYFPSSLHATSMLQFLGFVNKSIAGTFGIQMIYVGLGLAVLLALIQKRLRGIGEIANVIQIFADTLSYLRLYALALASSIMAETFNTMGYELGFFLGAIVIFLGHGVNILLGTAGGVIHGLRLNFLEWYHYSFEGGGKLLRPLQKLKRSD